MEHIKKPAPIRRRGILAIGAALAAGVATKGAAQPAAAAATTVTATNFIAIGTGSGGTGVEADATFGVGVFGRGTDQGTTGISTSGSGIFGSSANGTGVAAFSTTGDAIVATTFATGTKTAVTGKAGGNGAVGVLGIGSTAVQGQGGQYGVVGTVLNNTGSTIAVWGNNTNTQAGPIGVYGNATNGIGVFGTTSAAGQFGVVGQALADNAFGIAGIANTNGSAAFAGSTTNPNAFAASFQGHVQVFDGAFDVFPMGNKHGLALHPDGSYRTFYSVESPECWVEDFGEGTLANGAAEVSLEKDFAALIHTDRYHVFLTPHSDHHLHVAQRRDGGFSVAADTALAALKGKKPSDLTGTFSWRVVAKPKTTANVERLAKGRLAPKMDIAKLPKQPAAPQTITPKEIMPPGTPPPSPTP